MSSTVGNVMRELYSRGWITTRDGNISYKIGDDILITPSGWRKNIIYPENLVKLKLKNNKLIIPDNVKPSGELHMHYLLIRNAKEDRAVVHAHPTYTVAALYRGYTLNKVCSQFPEIFRYTKVGPSVSALPAISKELGEATAESLGIHGSGIKYDIVGQDRHGVTAVASNPWKAFEHIERLEHICQIILSSGVSPEATKNKI